MATGDTCDLCGVFYDHVKAETWQNQDLKIVVPESFVEFALIHDENLREVNICEVCYDNQRIESKLSRDETREAFYQFGLGFSSHARFEKAKIAFLQSLKIEERSDCLASLRYIEKKLGNREKAIEYYRRALEIDPNHFQAKANLENLTQE